MQSSVIPSSRYGKPASSQNHAAENGPKGKSKDEYTRILVLVAIVVGLAVVASLYINEPKSCSGIIFLWRIFMRN